MAINLAARRGAKNQRRKAAVAQKRKAEMEAGTLAGRVRLALADPIQHCLLTRETFDVGVGTLIIARGATPYGLTLAGFLLDIHALGVKDTFFTSMSGKEMADYLDRIADVAPADPVDPAYARKLLHDLVTWSRSKGFTPHRDYPKLEPIFGAVSAAACDVEFSFGFDGRPLLVGEASDTLGRLNAQRHELTVDADDVKELSESVMPA